MREGCKNTDAPPSRIVVESVAPEIDGGRFPIKRLVGDEVEISADIVVDGSDPLAARLLFRRRDPYSDAVPPWQDAPMHQQGNDRWSGQFRVEALGRYEYAVEAWIERAANARRAYRTRSPRQLQIIVERERAGFGAWYEMFPRSAGTDPNRSATFAEAAERLPDIAAMGFDVLYLPPIHPIGRTGRKGRNNSPQAEPGDPGSPWAVGGPEGGHTAVEPGLGTLRDFELFVARARDVGLEVALDLAFHCSPDHPYVREHPEWFAGSRHGGIPHAENPPKAYEDIYPFDFDGSDWQGLHAELKRIVLFWIDHGIRIFRVDNPHTKPFAFWEWLLDEIRAGHPDVIFLAEAFTRPALMRRLAKVGFSQSYTYFIWRTAKAELTAYLTELAHTDVREYLRPNLFTNTPDILHASLQEGGRPAFQARFVLAATLGASYGIYSGFELCEDRAIPGTEEYRNSEKFEHRAWDWDRPGHIKDLITRVNEIRRGHPALRHNWNLSFHDADNEAFLCYSKATPDASDVLVVVVSLDPRRPQQGWVELPVERWGLRSDTSFVMDELLSGQRCHWTGGRHEVRLDPSDCPAKIWHLIAR